LFGLYAFDRQIHKYDQDQPEVVSVLRNFRAVLDEYPERMAVGEVISLDMALRYVGNDKLHLAFNFDFLRQPWNAASFHRSILSYIRQLPADAQPCFVLGNHDVNRFPSRFGGGNHSDNRTKVAATLLLTLPGTPFIYYGEEIGMQNTPIPRAEIQDPPGRRFWPFYKGRDPARTPMQWTADKNSGFTTGIPWLRLNKDFMQRNVSTQSADPKSVLNYYRKLISLRRITPSLRQGNYQSVPGKSNQVLAYLRQNRSETCLIMLNFEDRACNFRIPDPPAGTAWDLRLSSIREEPQRSTGGEFRLHTLEACIFAAVRG
jgi:alpha-glucosidase